MTSDIASGKGIGDITETSLYPVTGHSYVHPFLFNYKQKDVPKTLEMVELNNSAAVIVFNTTSKKLVFLKQFRPAIYIHNIDPQDREQKPLDTVKYPASLGITMEVCASVLDKELTTEDLLCEQVLIDCGYNIMHSDLKRVVSYRAGVDYHGSEQTLFYCEVSNEMKCAPDDVLDDELIEVVEMSIPEIEDFFNSPQDPLPCPPSTLFAIMWFLHYKAKKYRD